MASLQRIEIRYSYFKLEEDTAHALQCSRVEGQARCRHQAAPHFSPTKPSVPYITSHTSPSMLNADYHWRSMWRLQRYEFVPLTGWLLACTTESLRLESALLLFYIGFTPVQHGIQSECCL